MNNAITNDPKVLTAKQMYNETLRRNACDGTNTRHSLRRTQPHRPAPRQAGRVWFSGSFTTSHNHGMAPLSPSGRKVRLVLLKRCFYRSRGLLPLGNVSVKEDVNGFFSRTKKTLSSLHGCHMGFAASPPLLHTRTGSGRVCRSYKHREWYHAVCVMRVARGQSKVVRF